MQPAREFEHAKFNLFQAIVEQAPDAIIFVDHGGAIQVWNHGAETVFGYAAAEVLGKSLNVIIPERLRNAHWEGFHPDPKRSHVSVVSAALPRSIEAMPLFDGESSRC